MLPYIPRQVRDYDRDRFILSLFAPADRREDLLTLYAFNLELARIRELVREPMMGFIRLQWWRDAIASLYDGKILAHEILQALAPVIERYRLPREALDQLINAREHDLDDKPPATLDDFLSYAKATSVPLARLGIVMLAGEGQEAASLAAEAYAIVGLLRAVPFMARQRRIFLPQDLLTKQGVSVNRIYDLKPPPALADVIEEILSLAEQRIDECVSLRRQMPSAVRKKIAPLLLQADLARLQARRIGRCGYDVFSPRLGRPHPLQLPYILWKSLF